MSRRVLFHIVAMSLVVVTAALFLSCSSSGTDVAVDKEDDTWPSQVADLTVSAFTDQSVTLAWTAPGDDTTSGTAAGYDLRYSTDEDLWSIWDEAVQATGEPSPLAAGSPQTMTISGLATDSTYYFALRTSDEAGNWSLISNICRATCFNDFVVTFADANLETAVRTAIAKPSGDIMKSDLLDLTDLFAEDIGMSDLSGIEHCVSLERLFAMNNAVVDLSPLAQLANIIVLNFSVNNISDITVLVDNPGLGNGDEVHLDGNPLSAKAIMTDIPALTARGVVVFWTHDTTEPAAVTDLHATALDASSATFAWTAPGDDGNNGTPYEYDLRYAADPSGLENWTNATPVPGVPAPGEAGTTETMQVSGLETDVVYYFAVKTRDESDNWSALSNVVKVVPYEDAPVTFPDSGLESAVRTALAKPSGAIYQSDLFPLTELDGSQFGISDLTGIEYCVNLESLVLNTNQIGDISLLAGLTRLQRLELNDNIISDIGAVGALTQLTDLYLRNNRLSDISAVAGLVALNNLLITGNQLSDISAVAGLNALLDFEAMNNSIIDITPLTGLTNLMYVFLSNNGISNIEPVAAMTGLRYLYLDLNQVVDLSALSGLLNLQELALRYNQIVDIAPLVANAGLATGDRVLLQNNPLSAESITVHIPALEARGVIVGY